MRKRTLFALLASLSFSLLVFSFSFVSAQDAVQCTPADVKLTRDLRFPNDNNIYLGLGKLNFSSTPSNLYAANEGGNLLLKSPAAILLQSDSKIEFQNANGANVFAGIYAKKSDAPAAIDDNPPNPRTLIVNGNIESREVKGLDRLCVGAPCISSWSQICDPGSPAGQCNKVQTSGDINSGANLSANGNISTVNGNIYTTNGKINANNNDINGKRLCIGGACYDSWAAAVHGGLNTTYTGTGKGVFEIIAGDGIAISGTNDGGMTYSTKGEGDVTITNDGVTSLKAGPGITIIGPAKCNGGTNDGQDCTLPDTVNFCGAGVCEQTGSGDMVISGGASSSGNSGWRLIAQASDWTEESETTINYPDQILFTVDSGGYPDQRVNIGNFNSWSPSDVTKLIFKVKNRGDDFCAGGDSVLVLGGGGGVDAKCQDWQLDTGGAKTKYVNNANRDWIRLMINGDKQITCPDQLGRPDTSDLTYDSTHPGTFGHQYFDVFCYYTKNVHWIGDLLTFKIQEADWSADYSMWEWEIWGCDDCIDPMGLNSLYLNLMKHTKSQCTDGADTVPGTADDGTVINDSGRYFCKFATATDACPAGWLQYKTFSTTISRTCNDNGYCSGSGKTCTTTLHPWSDAAQETCGYASHYTNWTGCHGTSHTCYADITEIGCY